MPGSASPPAPIKKTPPVEAALHDVPTGPTAAPPSGTRSGDGRDDRGASPATPPGAAGGQDDVTRDG